MRSANKTVYIEPGYSQNRNQFQTYSKEMFQQSILSQSRMTTGKESQKTEQPVKKYVSTNAIKSMNQQLYQIVNMDPRTAESHLRKSAKHVYDLIDNELLLNIKHLSNMKLLMYDTILMYVEEFSEHEKDKYEWKQKQKQLSNSIAKSVSSMKQQDLVALQNLNLKINNKQLQNLKQTIPFIPKDKSKIPKSTRTEFIQEELSSKIESTRQSLQNLLKKIQNNNRLTGQDIMRLKRSVVNVSQLKPSYFLNLQNLNTTQASKNTSVLENSRPQSRQGKIRTQSSSKNRTDSKCKTFTGGFGHQQQAKSFEVNSKASQQFGSDEQGNKLLIQQLQQIIERKQNRIKELTKELSKNLADQKQLQKTIENFQIEIEEIQNQRKNFNFIIQKLQQENLNYQLQIKELKQSLILKNQVDKLSTSYQEDSSQYQMLKQFQMRQKVQKFIVRKELDVTIQNTPNLQSESTQKNLNSLSGAIAFNDISEITPKRLNKKLLLPSQIEESYILESNVITTRKNAASQVQSKQKRRDQSISKYQMIGGSRTQMKLKKQTDSYSMIEMKDTERQNYQKILFLQALTIQQMLQDI